MHTFISKKTFSAKEIESKERLIYKSLLDQSLHINEGNFTLIHPDDLRVLFEMYDTHYFNNGMKKLLGERQVLFRFSSRMTKAGAKTEWRTKKNKDGSIDVLEFGITVSTRLLFNTFQEGDPAVTVCGCTCHDRLEAMQKLFEHELVHLIEVLVWGDSNCSAPNFQSISKRFFGHNEHTHALITMPQRARIKHGIQVGDCVQFDFEGETITGFINRITVRATVLVEHAKGQPYRDGKRYLKYYIPLDHLRPLNPDASKKS